MSKISIEDIKKLRTQTGAGMMSAKSALEEAKGNFDQAVEILRLKGEATAAKKATRATEHGLVEAYIHNGKIGVLVEVACETDFVARTDDFKQLAHDLAMHIAASSPQYLSSDDIPKEIIDKENSIYRKEASIDDKPANVVDKIVEGKFKKYHSETCLLDQPFLKDSDKSVAKHLTDVVAKLGENIVINRFVRYELGE